MTDLQRTEIQDRCVVILGRTGVGKSTIANMIMGYDLTSQDPWFEISETRWGSKTCKIQEAMTEYRRKNTVYRIRVIDTIGLCDTNEASKSVDTKESVNTMESVNTKESVNTEESMQLLYNKLEEHFRKNAIVGANLILFVTTKIVFTKEPKGVFDAFKNKFDEQIQKSSALVITGCEAENTEARKKCIQKFRDDENTKEIAERMKRGVLTVGFPLLEDAVSYARENYERQAQQDANALMDLIVKCDTVHFTNDMFKETKKTKDLSKESHWACTIM